MKRSKSFWCRRNNTSVFDVCARPMLWLSVRFCNKKATDAETARKAFFDGLCKSDKFTAKAAHEAFSGFAEKKQEAGNEPAKKVDGDRIG